MAGSWRQWLARVCCASWLLRSEAPTIGVNEIKAQMGEPRLAQSTMVGGFRRAHGDGGAGIVAKRLGQETVQTQFGRVAEDRQTDGHALLAGHRRRPIGAEQPIPPRQIESEIAVVLHA